MKSRVASELGEPSAATTASSCLTTCRSPRDRRSLGGPCLPQHPRPCRVKTSPGELLLLKLLVSSFQSCFLKIEDVPRLTISISAKESAQNLEGPCLGRSAALVMPKGCVAAPHCCCVLRSGDVDAGSIG